MTADTLKFCSTISKDIAAEVERLLADAPLAAAR